MWKVWFKTGFKPWKLPPIPKEDVQLISDAIEERTAFIDMQDKMKGSGSIGKYVFYDAAKDVLFVFRIPITGYLNVFVHIRKRNGKFGQYEDEGFKVATITTSSIKPEENQIRYLINGWWVRYLNDLFMYLIEEQRRDTERRRTPHLQHLRRLEKKAAEQEEQLHEMF
ncbi:hypothetical protein [Alkalicoccus daliensis]|uniref:Uncharacterized protein n=1 Tax=Alkalicoccus daliensis TaxID=745820 RepID=A0A1H0EPT1_9BACI|nr:hypothetical protein [Alkalicoccus daliensis]SDN84371.1 hypothetical protein SAMN04488053_10410 [Alkalicoccus daliensis]